MRYKPYPKYKDSGIAWLGDVPNRWGIKRLKYLFEIKKRVVGRDGFDILSITQKGIRVKDIESGVGQLSMDYSKYQLVEVGDYAMNQMDLLRGYVGISRYYGVTSPDYRVFSIIDKSGGLIMTISKYEFINHITPTLILLFIGALHVATFNFIVKYKNLEAV